MTPQATGQATRTRSATSALESASSLPNDALGRDAFLQLLVTQLRHQDPMEPQANGDFIAQLAQFSALERLTQIQQTLEAISTALGVKKG